MTRSPGQSAAVFLRRSLKLRHLRMLLAIERVRTITGAAVTLGVSQVAASKALAEMEAGLGLQLFERRRGGLVPTEICLRMLESSRRIDREIDCLSEEFLMVNDGFKGRVRIGLQTQSAQPFFSRAIIDFKGAYPLITIELTLGTSHELAGDLARGQLHFVIGPSAMIDLEQGFAQEAIPAEQAVVVAGPKSGSAGRRVSWSELAECAWCLPPEGKLLRDHFDRIFAMEGLPLPANLIELPPTFLAESIVSASAFYAMVPSSVGNQWALGGDIHIVDIDVPPIEDSMRLIWSENGPLPPAARMFLSFVRGEIASELASTDSATE